MSVEERLHFTDYLALFVRLNEKSSGGDSVLLQFYPGYGWWLPVTRMSATMHKKDICTKLCENLNIWQPDDVTPLQTIMCRTSKRRAATHVWYALAGKKTEKKDTSTRRWFSFTEVSSLRTDVLGEGKANFLDDAPRRYAQMAVEEDVVRERAPLEIVLPTWRLDCTVEQQQLVRRAFEDHRDADRWTIPKLWDVYATSVYPGVSMNCVSFQRAFNTASYEALVELWRTFCAAGSSTVPFSRFLVGASGSQRLDDCALTRAARAELVFKRFAVENGAIMTHKDLMVFIMRYQSVSKNKQRYAVVKLMEKYGDAGLNDMVDLPHFISMAKEEFDDLYVMLDTSVQATPPHRFAESLQYNEHRGSGDCETYEELDICQGPKDFKLHYNGLSTDFSGITDSIKRLQIYKDADFDELPEHTQKRITILGDTEMALSENHKESRAAALELLSFMRENLTRRGDAVVWKSFTARIRFASHVPNICAIAAKVLEVDPLLVETDSPTYIFGDIHADLVHYWELESIAWPRGADLSPANIVVVGDFLNGKTGNAIELVMWLMCRKILAPNRLKILRGKHDHEGMTAVRVHPDVITFDEEIDSFFDYVESIVERKEEGLVMRTSIFSCIDRFSLAAIVDEVIFVCPGGIPAPYTLVNGRLSDINDLEKPLNPIERDVAVQLIWNDPVSSEAMLEGAVLNGMRGGFAPNTKRQEFTTFAKFFTTKALQDFMCAHGITLVVRASEARQRAAELNEMTKLIHIFIALPFDGELHSGAVLVDRGRLRVFRVVHGQMKQRPPPVVLVEGSVT